MFETISALVVFAVALVLIMVRPKKISEALIAAGGAIIMLALGRVNFSQAYAVLADKWDVFLFFLGLMTIAAIADSAGFFDWTSAVAVKLAKGSGLRLFLNVFLLGALISTFLSNDATALILTPVVYTLTTRLRLSPLPFMFACTFIADTASFTLPVSNPINILVTGSFPQTQDLLTFWKHLLVASILAIALNIVLFVLIFRRQIPARFDTENLESPSDVIAARDPVYFRFVSICLGLIALGYVTASLLHFVLALVALAGAVVLVTGAALLGHLSLPKLSREISWSIFLFIGGMFILVKGVENVGLTREMGHLFVDAAGSSPFLGVMVGTFGTALGTNLINNVPMALVMTSALGQVSQSVASPVVFSGLIFSTILGADLGPNLTTVGSLATVLWLLILRRKGLEVSPLQYFKLGIIVTPVMLLVSALAIWVSLLI
ncbi:MAG TPA: ArsB/NhaD family transporter [Chloroflexia bacterium]|nr:ArsB/NhaD family transporter [Chloroflexia bacterium]